MLLNNCDLILCTKNWMIFIKYVLKLNPQIKQKQDLKEIIKDNVGDILMNYIIFTRKDKVKKKLV